MQCDSANLLRPGAIPATNPSPILTVPLPDGIVDLVRREVRFRDNARHLLSKSEAGLLGYLARHPGRVISRQEILKYVWHLNPLGTVTRTVDMHVSKLRRKLRDHARRPAVLRTISGEGYLLMIAD